MWGTGHAYQRNQLAMVVGHRDNSRLAKASKFSEDGVDGSLGIEMV
jgi:hypothetical protein